MRILFIGISVFTLGAALVLIFTLGMPREQTEINASSDTCAVNVDIDSDAINKASPAVQARVAELTSDPDKEYFVQELYG